MTKFDIIFNDFLAQENAYFNFIKSCQLKKYSPASSEIHKHHIIPKYLFLNSGQEHFCESPQNIIDLSREDHIMAHQFLYLLYQNNEDKAAIFMLKGQTKESLVITRRLGAKSVHELLKKKKKYFWDHGFQKEMARRSINKMNAFEIRKKSGKIGGYNRQRNRVINASQKFIFFYQKKAVFCIFSCQTGGDVLKILQDFKQTPLKRVTPLLKGLRKN